MQACHALPCTPAARPAQPPHLAQAAAQRRQREPPRRVQQRRIAQHQRIRSAVCCAAHRCQLLLAQRSHAGVQPCPRRRIAAAATCLCYCCLDVFQKAINCLVGRVDDEVKLETLGQWGRAGLGGQVPSFPPHRGAS